MLLRQLYEGLWRRIVPFFRREVIIYRQEGELPRVPWPAGLTVQRLTTPDHPAVDSKEIRRGGVPWLGTINGEPCSIIWSKKGRNLQKWYIRLEPDDLVLYAATTFPRYRGRGIHSAARLFVLANEPHRTAYCDVAEWNTTAKKNIEKTGFVPIARKRKKKRNNSPVLSSSFDNKTLRVGYIAIDSPYRCSSWSGIPFHTLKELHNRFDDIHVIDTPLLDRLLRHTSGAAKYGVLPSRSRIVSFIFQKIIDRKIARIDPDVLISVGAAHKISRISSDAPLVHVTDALYPTIIAYYDKYKNLSAATKRLGFQLQKEVVQRSSAIILASEWAALSASECYPEACPRISIVPLGANLHPKSWEGPSNDLTGPPRLLFVGYDWERKGGDLALEAFKLIQARWPDAELHIVGCTPQKAAALQSVFLHGVLRIDREHERGLLEQLFHRSSFLFMPSKQEAYGIAYCEACSFGLPPVASRTGGVPMIIKDGVNGILLDESSCPADYASRIEECWSRPEMYREMQLAARRAYELRLNWNAWGEDVEAVLRHVGGARYIKTEESTSVRDD